ncbi:MAG: helix-turn-helix transcriptional regulator [Treponema sp.]|nr:helix-turn-helix transcriptional regulator [Treponema sp.]
MGFKENLKAELSYQNILVKELALKSGISKRTIDNYLRDKHSEPTAENAVKIARVLGVSVEYLVTGDVHAKENGAGSKQSTDIRKIQKEASDLTPEARLIILDLIDSLKTRLQ